MHDLDELQTSPSLRDGVTGLWIAVFVDACEMAIRYGNEQAKAYLLDENYFFDVVAEQFSYTPEGLRERIRKALTRAREDHPGRLALRGAVKRSPSETGEEATGEGDR